jgi:hypothetical protein
LVSVEDCFQTREGEVTGGEQATMSFGHSTLCLFLCEDWHKKMSERAPERGEGDRGEGEG